MIDSYDTTQAEVEFANGWYENCLEYSSSDFWAGVGSALALKRKN